MENAIFRLSKVEMPELPWLMKLKVPEKYRCYSGCTKKGKTLKNVLVREASASLRNLVMALLSRPRLIAEKAIIELDSLLVTE